MAALKPLTAGTQSVAPGAFSAHQAFRQATLPRGLRDGPRATVAQLGSGGASEVRADHRRTVSGGVRREGRFWLKRAGSVGRCQVGSGYRVGLQVGGRGFESRTLHLKKEPICRNLSLRGSNRDNSRASAVRADRPIAVERCRVTSVCQLVSSDVGYRTGLSRRRSRVRVPSLPSCEVPANRHLLLSEQTG
jgi:hypothetical protein